MKLTEAHACDLCKKPAYEIAEIIDGRIKLTRNSRTVWAWVCPNCWLYFSATSGKLGTGLGQRWKNVPGGNKLEG